MYGFGYMFQFSVILPKKDDENLCKFTSSLTLAIGH